MTPPTGMIVGGWEFVQAAYVVSAVVLTSYFVSVHLRYRRESERARREGSAKDTP